MRITTTAIEWDTDGEVVDLPQKVELEVDDEDDIVDALSDQFGFCILSLYYKVIV